MKAKSFFIVALLFLGFKGMSQTFKGVVLDVTTKKPIATASVYFDNTTLGVTTNHKGQFSITYSEAIQSPLIVSYLGYEKEIIKDYRETNNITILLKEAKESLDEVIINANDGLTRRQKLRLFKREFLGTSSFANSCKILNEHDIKIRYHKKDSMLTAYSTVPIRIENKALQYLLEYDLASFTMYFSNNIFDTKSVRFIGNNYYQNLKIFDKQKAVKNRERAYNGSRLQFIRALYSGSLEDNKYLIYFKRLKVDSYNFFNIEFKDNSTIKEVSLNKPVDILYNKREQSTIEFLVYKILIDAYGNYNNATKVRFSGVMGDQRIGEMLPFDYGL